METKEKNNFFCEQNENVVSEEWKSSTNVCIDKMQMMKKRGKSSGGEKEEGVKDGEVRGR